MSFFQESIGWGGCAPSYTSSRGHCRQLFTRQRYSRHSRSNWAVRFACHVEGAPQPEPAQEASLSAVPRLRFQPFNPNSLARRRMLDFQRAVPCEGGGMLLIQPLEEDCIKETADILTESFAESMGYLSVYKNFLRRQIVQYLHHHVSLPPKTVLLVALLLSPEEWQEAQLHEAAARAGAGSDGGSQGSNGTSDAAEASSSSSDRGSTGSSSSASSCSEGRDGGAATASLGGAGSIGSSQPGAVLPNDAGARRQQDWQPEEEQQEGRRREQQRQEQRQEQARQQEEWQLRVGAPGGIQEAAAAAGMMFPTPFSIGGPSDIFLENSGSSDSDTEGEKPRADAGTGTRASGQGGEGPSPEGGGSSSGGSGGRQRRPGLVVGVVEVSFTASTRSKYITLNPPEDSAYLCNMAVAPEHRGRGHGTRLVRAAEDMAARMGEREIYLHVRVQDEAAARLYQKSGFQVIKEDNLFVVLLRQDRRFLMRKRLR